MVRLRLVQGVVAYHLGRDKEARLLLEKVTSKLQLLAVDEASLGDRKLVVDNIIRRREERAEVARKVKEEREPARLQEKLGKHANGNWVNVGYYNTLQGMGYSGKVDGDYDTAKRSLKSSVFRRSEDVNRRDDRACAALHYAVKVSHLRLARLLLDKGADLQAEDKHGWSVLHYAVRYGNLEVTEFLIEAGANLHAREKRGWNCLHLAARNGQSEKARLLLEAGLSVGECQTSGWNSLHLAVRYGQPDTISTLLEYGIDIDAENQGWTALQLAALNGHMDIVSILLNKGANSAILNRERKTALDIAREEGYEKIAAIIIETEFQGNNPDLPSPPPSPTPPSAPPIETFGPPSPPGASEGIADTFDQWKIKLQQDLENISNDDSSSDKCVSDVDQNDDGRITWKSFEEEKLELLQQLEKARLKEVTRISEEIQKREDKHYQTEQRSKKQQKLLETQIENMRASIPSAEETSLRSQRYWRII